MDKDKFTGVTIPVWWLLDLQLGPEDLKEKRKALGKCWGWEEDGWFAQPERVGAVFDFLYPRHQVLLDELDSQVDDPYVRMKWIDDLIQAKTSFDEQAATEAATTAENVAAAPAADQAVAKREDPPAPRRASAFGRPNTAEATPSEQPGEGRAPTGADPAGTPAAEPRRPSPFARMAAATGSGRTYRVCWSGNGRLCRDRPGRDRECRADQGITLGARGGSRCADQSARGRRAPQRPGLRQ